MADKLMYIPNDHKQNNHFYSFKLVVETFEHSTKLTNQSKFTKSPTLLRQQVRKYKTLETSESLHLSSRKHYHLTVRIVL